MTHSELAERRKAIADYVQERGAGPQTRSEAAVKFGASLSTVSLACKLHGVAGVNRPGPHSLRIIAELCNTDKTIVAVAAEFGVSKQWVSQIYIECRANGVPVRERSKGTRPKKGLES